MNKNDLNEIILKVNKENIIFSQKNYLDTLTLPAKIIGRHNQARDLVRLLLGYQKGLVVPFISVYGRSGGGKSTLVRFVCANLDVKYAYVNLRKAKTIFGCINLILAELLQPNVSSPQGLNTGIERIEKTIDGLLQKSDKLFVLILDEFDVLFGDKRSKPSDFVHNLVAIEERLREKGKQMCIIGISNNVIADYALDDRVRSRIGSSEVFFEAYSKNDVLKILTDRAKKAFSEKVKSAVLESCAQQSSAEHGDARRAINLLRVGAELASTREEKLSENHIILASDQIQKDRIVKILSTSSYHFRLVCAALARISYLIDKPWHATSVLYNQYKLKLVSSKKPLSYRRVSELLVELANFGIAESHTSSRGRHGYGTEYKLSISPEIAGKACSEEWWNGLVKSKTNFKAQQRQSQFWKPSGDKKAAKLYASFDDAWKIAWKNYVGLKE